MGEKATFKLNDKAPHGSETNILGNVRGQVLSGVFHGPIQIGDTIYSNDLSQVRDSPTDIDVVILTVLPEEYDAVCIKLKDLKRLPADKEFRNIYAWNSGLIYCHENNGNYSVIIGMTGRAGTNESAAATIEAIERWNPHYIIFIGIAGGMSGSMKGDIVIADIIHGYEYGKIGDFGFLPRSNWTYPTDHGLFTGAVAYALNQNWRKLISKKAPEECKSQVISGEIASGDKVIDNPNNEFFDQVKQAYPRIVAVEMEGAGLGNAIEKAYAHGRTIGFLMIRGISDEPYEDHKRTRTSTERDNWKSYASDVAAAFAVGWISDGLPVPAFKKKAKS